MISSRDNFKSPYMTKLNTKSNLYGRTGSKKKSRDRNNKDLTRITGTSSPRPTVQKVIFSTEGNRIIVTDEHHEEEEIWRAGK
jgi:hypothetical protein